MLTKTIGNFFVGGSAHLEADCCGNLIRMDNYAGDVNLIVVLRIL